MSNNLTWNDLGKGAIIILVAIFAWQFSEFNSTLKDNTKEITSLQIDVADIHGDIKSIKKSLDMAPSERAENLTQIKIK